MASVRRLVLSSLALAGLAWGLPYGSLDWAKLDRRVLDNMQQVLQEQVDMGELPGASVLYARYARGERERQWGDLGDPTTMNAPYRGRFVVLGSFQMNQTRQFNLDLFIYISISLLSDIDLSYPELSSPSLRHTQPPFLPWPSRR
jgi:hypothetical protein